MAKKPPDRSYDLAPAEAPRRQEPSEPPRRPEATERPRQARTELGQERTCQYCGFSFHGPPKARCPECAAPMDSSTTDQLKFANPAWVRRVATGMVLVIPGIVVHIIAAFLRWDILPEPQKILQMQQATLHAIAGALLAVAVFVMTGKEPGTKRGKLALWSRVAVIAALIFWIVISMVIGQMSPYSQTIRALTCLTQGFQVALSALLGIYCGDLAMRIPDDGLHWHAVHGGWVVAAANGLLMGLHFLQLTTKLHFMFFMCSFPMVGGLLAIFMWAAVTLLRLALNLRLSARAGDEIVALRTQRMAARVKK